MAKNKMALTGLCAVITFFASGYAMAGTWTPFDAPEAISTNPCAIDGSNIVGNYGDSSYNGHAFLYNGSNWTTLEMPGQYPVLHGIDGGNIVGSYYGDDTGDGFLREHGLFYDGVKWTTLNAPSSIATETYDISGSNIIGNYTDNYGDHGFLYDGSTWTILNASGFEAGVIPYGIDGSNIVGYYMGTYGRHGFLYDGTTWTTLDMPGARETYAQGIDGSNIVGYYTDTYGCHSFLYDGTTWTTLDMPGARETYASNISGSNIVGYYIGDSAFYRGFIYTIPEPATLSLLALGGLAVMRKRGK